MTIPVTPHHRIRAALRSSEARLAVGVAAFAVAPGVAGVFAAQSLGTVGRGNLAVSLALATVAGTLGLRGLDVALLSVGRARQDLDSLPIARGIVLRRSAGVLVVEGAIAGIVACAVLRTVDVALVALTAGLAALSTLFVLLRSLNLAAGRVGVVMRSDLVAAAVLLLLATAVRLLDWAFEAYLVSTMLGLVVGCGSSLLASPPHRSAQEDVGRMRADLRRVGRSAWFARGLQATAFRLDRVVLAVLAGVGPAGVYAAIVPFAEMTTIVQLHLAQLATVRLSATSTDVRWSSLREWRVAASMSVALGTAMFVLAGPTVDLVYGDEYADGVAALRILAVASAVSVVWRFVEAELYARHAPKGAVVGTAAAAAVVLGGTAALSGLGAAGASIASLIGYSVASMVVARSLREVRRAA